MVGAVTMVRQNRLFVPRSLGRLAPGAMVVSLVACASGSGSVQIGSSMNAEAETDADVDEDEDLIDDVEHQGAPGPTGEAEEDTPATRDDEGLDEDGEGDELSPHHEPPGARLARAALHAATPADNHMGLVMAISERTSDLPWVLAIENRSPHPITLAALPELLTAKIIPPMPEPASEGEPPSGTSSGGTVNEPEPILCGEGGVPKSLDDDDKVELAPGQLLFHEFDPRDLCEEEDVLEEGATVEMTYGFPTQTKKLWRAGKLTTVEAEQTAPFVAERKTVEGEKIVPLKHLRADPIRLDQTYPLSEVSALPIDDDELDASEDSKPAPPPPLKLTISPLGTTSRPEDGVVQVQLSNTSGKSMKLFVRRELFTYEVSGPNGEATCQMHPADRSPDPAAFSSLAPGQTYSLSTRLAEACPAGTWDSPGTYSVSAYFRTTADGSEHGISAFMGSAATQSPARLVVPGSETSRRRRMVLIPVKPPTVDEDED